MYMTQQPCSADPFRRGVHSSCAQCSPLRESKTSFDVHGSSKLSAAMEPSELQLMAELQYSRVGNYQHATERPQATVAYCRPSCDWSSDYTLAPCPATTSAQSSSRLCASQPWSEGHLGCCVKLELGGSGHQRTQNPLRYQPLAGMAATPA